MQFLKKVYHSIEESLFDRKMNPKPANFTFIKLTFLGLICVDIFGALYAIFSGDRRQFNLDVFELLPTDIANMLIANLPKLIYVQYGLVLCFELFFLYGLIFHSVACCVLYLLSALLTIIVAPFLAFESPSYWITFILSVVAVIVSFRFICHLRFIHSNVKASILAGKHKSN